MPRGSPRRRTTVLAFFYVKKKIRVEIRASHLNEKRTITEYMDKYHSAVYYTIKASPRTSKIGASYVYVKEYNL